MKERGVVLISEFQADTLFNNILTISLIYTKEYCT